MRKSFVRTRDPSAFFDEPARRYIVGESFCFWQDDTRAFGSMYWGRPRPPDFELMTRVFEAAADPRCAGHASITDIRALEGIDFAALEGMIRFLVERRASWGATIGRQVLIHRGGAMGATIAGVLMLARLRYPVECFDADPRGAFEWAGAGDVFEDIEAMREEILGTPEILRAVREAFREHGLVGVDRLAVLLRTSSRSLQRRLHEAGTSLREERKRFLDHEVERLLSGTDLDLDAIAAAVGLSSTTHLVRAFKASHGVTPGVSRAQQRPSKR